MGRIFKRKREGSHRTPTPVPLVEALGRATPAKGGWRVEDAAYGMAHTNIAGGVMSVPLTDEICSDCKLTHGPAVRIHEMMHVAISPDSLHPLWIPKELYEYAENQDFRLVAAKTYEYVMAKEVYEPSPEARPVDPEAQMAAEEFLIGRTMQNQTGNMYGMARRYSCLPKLKKAMVRLLSANNVRDSVLLTAAEAYNYDFLRLLRKMGYGTYLSAIKKASSKEYDKAVSLAIWNAHWLQPAIEQVVRNSQRASADALAQLQVSRDTVAIIISLAIGEWEAKAVRTAALERKAAEEAAKAKAERPEPEEIDEGKDLERLKHLARDKKTFQEALEKLEKGHKPPESDGGFDRWGAMFIDTPPLTQRLPEWKRRKIARPVEEGSIPAYMHRYATDMRVFKQTKKGDTGLSVLIDASGSMGLSPRQIDEIIAKVPGTTIGVYNGSGAQGTLRIVAKDGKRVATADMLKPPGGGNVIDFPALQWLAKQVEPRLWVSDGYATTIGDALASPRRMAEIVHLQKKARITRVENAQGALDIVNGKRELER